MKNLLDSLSSDNLVLLCVIMGVIALFLAIAISIEIYNSNKRYQKILDQEKEKNKEKEIEKNTKKLKIIEDKNVKYVDEDGELEKTKAKIELANLREKLKKEEEEKQKLIEMNLALVKNKKEEDKKEEKVNNNKVDVENKEQQLKTENENIEVLEDTIEIKNLIQNPEIQKNSIKDEKKNEKVAVNVSIENKEKEKQKQEEKLDEALQKVREVNNKDIKEIVKEKIKEEVELNTKEDIEENDKIDDEEEAIISYDELKKSQTFGYTDEEMEKYVDEKDAIISIKELERLYLESQQIETTVEEPKIEFEVKKVEDLPQIKDDINFQNSPYISPVYGMSKSEKELMLEQTANLEKLNEEIRKTNEFLKTLKDLKKNLE